MVSCSRIIVAKETFDVLFTSINLIGINNMMASLSTIILSIVAWIISEFKISLMKTSKDLKCLIYFRLCTNIYNCLRNCINCDKYGV